MKLFCFTHAGGTGEFFNLIKRKIQPPIDVFTPDYAGHGTRHKEQFYNDFSGLAGDMYSYVKYNVKFGDDYALFGYSMGCITVIEVLRLIIEHREIPLPKHIFLAAHEPEAKKELKGYSPKERLDLIKARTIKFGGIPRNLENNNTFWRMYLPIYSADYDLIGQYDFETINITTDIPVTVFYSETDTPLVKMERWKKFFRGKCEFIKYDGNHFFMQDHYCEMARIILQQI